LLTLFWQVFWRAYLRAQEANKKGRTALHRYDGTPVLTGQNWRVHGIARANLTFAAKPAFPAGRERIPSAVNTGDLNQGWVKT